MALKNNIPREKRAQLILYVLAVYVLLQLIWWGFLLVHTYSEVYNLQSDLTEAHRRSLLQKKIWMLVGEGSVFLVLMYIGFRYVNRNIAREIQLARMQRTFLLSVTHELKTPIAAIKLCLDTLKTRKLTQEQTEALLSDAQKETKRLQVLSENILLTQRIDDNPVDLPQENVELSLILRNEALRFAEIFHRKIEVDIPQTIRMQGDTNLLQSLCSNLLENAVKYSPADTVVHVKAMQQGSKITLSVSDHGIGIPVNERPFVFKKFYRIGNEERRKHKGTGLGLYIVANVVRLHQGRVVIADNHPSGTVMTVIFEQTQAL